MKLSINYTYLFAAIFFSTSVFSNDHQIPNLVGTWVGVIIHYLNKEDTDLGKKKLRL